MSSPITNLKKTSLAPKKIIRNEFEFTNKGCMPIEAEVYYARKNSPPDSMDKENLILGMTNRLAVLENEMTEVKNALERAMEVIHIKDAEIAMLKQQLFQQGDRPVTSSVPVADNRVNNTYEEYNEMDEEYIDSTDSCDDRSCIDWEMKYYDLLKRVLEMEKFLADYGMIWVGDKNDGHNGIIENFTLVPDFDKIIAIIGELNERISSECYVKVVGNEARFQKADILNITFYNDGMELENKQFRKYSTESALVFFRDLEDGYYPTELQETYPNGVIFKVTDKRSISYEGPRNEELVFSGPGYRLGTKEPSIGESKQAQAYFQFDVDTKKEDFLKHILKEKPLDENIFRYNYLIKSESTPVLCPNDPTGHPQETRKYKQREYRELQNKGRGPKMNYDSALTVSSDDSMSMNTIYDHSYSNIDYKKKIYDATAELAHSRTGKPISKDAFDPDKQYEHMVVIGKKGQQSLRRNNHKSSSERQAVLPNMGPLSDKNLHGQAKPDMKHHSASKEDEMRRGTSKMSTEYEKRSKESVEEVGSERNSLDEEDLPTKLKGNAKFTIVPLKGEAPVNSKTSVKSKSRIKSYAEDEQKNRPTSLIPYSGGDKEHEALSKYNPKAAKQLSEGKVSELNIVPSNKRSSDETGKEDIKSNSPDSSESGDLKIEDYTLLEVENRYADTLRTIGGFNYNKESENFVLGNKQSKSPNTSEYRDAFGAKIKYVVHQCSTDNHVEKIIDNNDRSIQPKFLKLFSKGKVCEPKIISLNRKTSNGQIELNMKSYNGNEIYSAYLYPDDPISKVWSLTELNCEDFVVTVGDNVLHINIPLKNYNINGDVTLNISKRKPSFVINTVDTYKSNGFSDQGDVNNLVKDDYFSDKVDNEDGYSS